MNGIKLLWYFNPTKSRVKIIMVNYRGKLLQIGLRFSKYLKLPKIL
jgi:hypothetical protein